MLVVHQPNGGGKERPRFFTVEEKKDTLAIQPETKSK